MPVGHLGRAVHRHAHELRGTGAADIIVPGRGDDIIAVAVAGAGRGFILARTGGVGIEQPERDIHALDLLDMILRREGIGQESLPAIVFFQCGLGGVLIQHKRQDKLRPLHAAELPRDDRWIAAVRAACRGGRLVTDQLCAAGRAGIAAQSGGLVFAPDGVWRRCLFILCRGFGSGFFFSIERFDLSSIVAAAAEVTHQLSAGTVKVKRTGTGRALVVGKLRCHYASPLFPSVCSCPARSSKKSRRVLRVLPSASR